MTTPQKQILDFTEDDARALVFNMTGTDGVTPINITGYTVVMYVSKLDAQGQPTGQILSKTASLTNPTQGVAQFSFSAGDLNFAGLADAQIKITDTGGNSYRVRGMALRVAARLGP